VFDVVSGRSRRDEVDLVLESNDAEEIAFLEDAASSLEPRLTPS
jgi:hypothetical protein